MSILKKHLPFLHSDDAFFVLEVLGDLLRATHFSVSPESKQITIVRSLQYPITDTSAGVFAGVLRRTRREFKLPVSVRTIVLLDHRRAAVLSGTVSLMRSDPKAEIKQAELENLVSQGLWKLGAGHRTVAAGKLEISEARTCLADADVVRVRLDHHRVVNPVGFAAKTIEFSYRETFVDQGILQVLQEELTEDNLATVAEGSAVLAGLVAKLNPSGELLFVDVGQTESIVYHIDQMILSFVDSFIWGSKTLILSIAKEFAVEEREASVMIERYARNEVSPTIRRALERAASGELAILSNGLAAHQPEGAPLPVFVHASIPLPAVLFDPAFAHRLGLDLLLTEVNEQFVGVRTGFVVHLEKNKVISENERSFTTAVGAIADVYATTSMSPMTKTAKQRARWAQAG